MLFYNTNLCTEWPYQMTCNVCMANISTLKLDSEVPKVTQAKSIRNSVRAILPLSPKYSPISDNG